MITRSASRINERKWTRLTCVFALVLGVLAFFPGPDSGAEDLALAEQSALLRRRLDRLSARDDARHVEAALAQARLALEKADASTEDPGAATRAHGIARAAMVLAERQLDRRAVQAELFDAQRRLTATRERAAAQRRVLDALLRERAELAREGAKP